MGASEQLAPEDTPTRGRGFIGRYQLCFELASGGMAKLFLARVAGPGGFEKLVALKRIHSHLAEQEEFVQMFLDEARIASRIDHPNVCTVFDFGEHDGNYFIAMEYLLGETAGRLTGRAAKTPELRDSKKWLAYSMRIVAESCEGLHAAHELRGDRGELLEVVHRDVSPHNLFIGYDGSVKVVDFGIARATNRLHTTQAGTIKGRYAYMAPEQARGGKIDRRADVWSLGVILWEMLTCRRLFKRDNDAETIMAVVYDPIPRPSELRQGIPDELDDVVMKALERDAEDRFPSARAMAKELNRLLLKEEEPVGTPELGEVMGELFQTQRELRREMVEEARTMGAGTVLRAPDDDTHSVRLQPSEAAIGDLIHRTGKPRKRPPTWVLGVAGGVLGGAALTLLMTLALGGDDEQPASSSAAANAPKVAVERVDERTSGATPPAEPEPEPAASDGHEPEAKPSDAPGTMVVELEEVQTAADDSEAQQDEAASAADPAAQAEEEEEQARTPRRARPVRRAPGAVNVVTPGGWADIYVRGRRVGRSPGRIELPSGRQVLELRPFGKSPGTRTVVRVPAGGTARVSVRIDG